MSSSRYELEVQKIHTSVIKQQKLYDSVATLIKGIVICACVYIICNMFVELAKCNPESLSFIARTIEKFNVERIVYWVVICICGPGYLIEKRRNKRLVKISGDQRHQLEKDDKFNERSKLNAYGRDERGE